MTFREWLSKIVVGDDHSVYDGIDICMMLEKAFEAGHDKALDDLVNDCTGTHTSYVEIHKEDVFERKIGK